MAIKFKNTKDKKTVLAFDRVIAALEELRKLLPDANSIPESIERYRDWRDYYLSESELVEEPEDHSDHECTCGDSDCSRPVGHEVG